MFEMTKITYIINQFKMHTMKYFYDNTKQCKQIVKA